MRKFSLVLVAAALLTAGNLFATNPSKTDPSKALTSQIGELLENNQFDIKDDMTATVIFTLNEHGEIVVLSVDTSDEALEAFVKGRLNYEKVKLDQYRQGKLYTVPVRIEA